MNIYYIDYENVSSQGLKGVEALTENDEVNLLYSKKADNVKIEMLTMLMASKAKIHFLPVHVGTPNALDFQLVTLLFLKYKEGDHCYIISKDSGYDCCIKTAAENGAPNVARYPNIESAMKGVPVKRTRRGKRTTAETPNETVVTAVKETKKRTARNASSEDAAKPDKEVSSSKAALAHSSDPANPAEAVIQEDAVRSSEQHQTQEQTHTAQQTHTTEQTRTVQQADAPEQTHTAEASHTASDENTKKRPSRRRGRKKAAATETEGSDANQSGQELPNASAADVSEPEGMVKSSPGEHVLQQRYLSKQFDPKMNPLDKAKNDADKPVSILSVIRRRNDIQLDMHQVDLIRNALKNSGNKQQFYSYFVKQLGQKQGIELYHSVKSSYTDLVNANII